MKQTSSFPSLQSFSFCLLVVLFIAVSMLYARFTWLAFEQLAILIGDACSRANQLLVSLSH
ncbi:MAG: hypothetical protein V4722_19675 [Bacteroidota bacterium]